MSTNHPKRETMSLEEATISNNMRTIALLLIGFLSLSGCGLVREQMAQSEYDRVIKEKALAVESSRDLDPIREKVWMGALKDEPPLSMMTLSEKATTAEKLAIEKWHEILLDQKKKLVALAKQYNSSTNASRLEVLYANRIALVVELYGQNIGYGEYNKKTKDLYVKRLQEEADTQQQQSLIQQMRPPAPPAPKTSFSCYTIGNQTHCN